MQRKAERMNQPARGDDDPDLAGIVPGPQPRPDEDGSSAPSEETAIHEQQAGPERPAQREAVRGRSPVIRKLYVGNLSYSVSSADLEQMFGQFGDVKSAMVIEDRDTGRSKGFGFVEMTSDQAARAAIDALNGQERDGRALMVNEAKPPENRRGGFSGGHGRGRY